MKNKKYIFLIFVLILSLDFVQAQDIIMIGNSTSSGDKSEALLKKLSSDIEKLDARTSKNEEIVEENGILFSQLMSEFRSYITTEKIYISGVVLFFLGSVDIIFYFFFLDAKKRLRKEISLFFDKNIKIMMSKVLEEYFENENKEKAVPEIKEAIKKGDKNGSV